MAYRPGLDRVGPGPLSSLGTRRRASSPDTRPGRPALAHSASFHRVLLDAPVRTGYDQELYDHPQPALPGRDHRALPSHVQTAVPSTAGRDLGGMD